jgi:hypothetical protein
MRMSTECSMGTLVRGAAALCALAAVSAADPGETIPLLQATSEPEPGALADRSPDVEALSGDAGDSSVEVRIGLNAKLPNPPRYYAVNTIEVQEGRDNACLLRLWGNMIDPRFSKGQDRRIVAGYVLDKCWNYTTHVDMKQAGFQPSQSRFIRALQVCDHEHPRFTLKGPANLGNLEVKGVRVRPAEVSNGGAVTPRDEEHEFVRPQCPDKKAEPVLGGNTGPGWSRWSSCGTGQVMTGVTLHFHKDKYFTGARVRCAYVRSLSGTTPVKDEKGY